MSQLLTVFSAESNEQWNYTVQPVAMGVGPSMRQGHSYIHVLSWCLMPLFMSFLLHFLAHSYTVHFKGPQLNELSTLSPTEQILVWGGRGSSYSICAPRELPLSSMLDVWLPTRERERGFLIHSVFRRRVTASAALWRAHSCCAQLTALSATWRCLAHHPRAVLISVVTPSVIGALVLQGECLFL